MILITLAYYLISHHRLESGSNLYQWMNLSGAILLGVQLFSHQSWPAFTLQVVWGLIAIGALINRRKLTRE